MAAVPAHAEDKGPAGTPDPSIATSFPGIANPLGLRPALAARGITYGINDVAEVLGNPSGGMREGTIFDNRLELVIDADLSKLAGWSGATVHVNAYRIDGHGHLRRAGKGTFRKGCQAGQGSHCVDTGLRDHGQAARAKS
jgi:carbohydrate-selective porin OprB